MKTTDRSRSFFDPRATAPVRFSDGRERERCVDELPRFLWLWLAALALGATSVGCVGMSGRAAAPDERGHGIASPSLVRPRVAGPTTIVHLRSYFDATLVRLDDADAVVEACRAPCDRPMPLDANYRIDGPAIRSTWPFRLAGGDGGRVVIDVTPRMRATYDEAKVLGAVGGIAEVIALGLLVGSAIVATDRHDAGPGGSSLPCPGCNVAAVGGALIGVAGMGLSLGGIILGIQEMSSGATQTAATQTAATRTPRDGP